MPGLSDSIREPTSWILAFIAMVFSIGKVWGVLDPGFYTSPYFIGILLGFAGHELAHRMVAIRHGLRAEFIAVPWGLLITFATGFIPGIVILAPGYVGVYAAGPYDPRGVARSVIAGPAANLSIGYAALLLSLILPGWSPYLTVVAAVNGWIAFFNLIPVPPLDGSKILRLDSKAWILMLAASIILWIAP